MKKKFIVIILLLISFITTNNYACFAEQANSSVPKMLQDIKGKDELTGYINKIESIRANISTIDISPATAKEKPDEIKKQINLYLSELSAIQNSLKNFDKKYSDSQSDLL
uniref:hypothetical protein n=1 Tax=Terrisporobacter sp. TaxID=1965305 RepID=UPI00260AB30A